MLLHGNVFVLAQAFASFVKEFGWKSVTIIYENEESLIRLQELLKFPKKYESMRVILRQLDPLSDDYRPMLKEIQKSPDGKKIVLDCSYENIEKVIKQAHEVGIISPYYNYFITSLVIGKVPFK